MIVGTAGHIDHGKSTLVRALTGVETDRLKEEKARGISIELGYAYTPLPNGDVLGFIDVPGHEKLVHTMAAGASGIDFALLLIAADDGVMPQTREHLAILELLGVPRGAIAVTKVDRVQAERLAQVHAEIASLVAGTFLQAAPVFDVNASVPDEPGVQALRHHLLETAQAIPVRSVNHFFRLAIDRVFTLPGHGTVVTGTAHSGQLHVGDDAADLRLMPADVPLRVRSIHAQNRTSDTGSAGQRCALNLAGIEKDAIGRGDWVADARCFVPSRNVDVELRLLSSAQGPLRAWTPLHIHLGAAHHVAHVVPLDGDTLAPGQTGRVQLVFDTPVCSMPGDRFIARNAQANSTLGGGRVLDANAPDRKRRAILRLAWLTAVAQMLDGADLRPVLEQTPFGMDEQTVQRITGRSWASHDAPTGALWIATRQASRVLILQHHWDSLCERLAHALTEFHTHSPDEPGVDAGRLRRIAMPTISDILWRALLETLQAQGRMVRNGPWLHRPEHNAVLDVKEQHQAELCLAAIYEGAYDPPWVRDLAQQFQVGEQDVRQLMRKLVRRGELAQVVRDLFYHHRQIASLAQLAASLCAQHGSVDAARFRDATRLGRKRAIQILEFFDRVGYTRRLRDAHVMRGDPAMFSKDPA